MLQIPYIKVQKKKRNKERDMQNLGIGGLLEDHYVKGPNRVVGHEKPRSQCSPTPMFPKEFGYCLHI